MRQITRAIFVLLAAAATAAISAGQGVPKKETVRLDRSALVAGTLVPAGEYRVEIAPDLDRIVFTQGKRTVAEIPCRVGLTRPVYPGNAVHYQPAADGDRLVRIVFAESKLAVDFAGSPYDAGTPGLAKAAERP